MAPFARVERNPMAYVEAVQNAVWSVESQQPILDIEPVEEVVPRSRAVPTMMSRLVDARATIALILSALGLFEVVAHSVKGRTRMLTGEVTYTTRPMGARVFLDHVNALERLARSGEGWAGEALDPDQPFLFVAAGGFKDSFHEVRTEAGDRPVITWTLADLFPEN